jgi:hypothetical protein
VKEAKPAPAFKRFFKIEMELFGLVSVIMFGVEKVRLERKRDCASFNCTLSFIF